MGLLLTGAVQVVSILLRKSTRQPLAKASHAFSPASSTPIMNFNII